MKGVLCRQSKRDAYPDPGGGLPGPLFCMARKVRQVAGPRLAMPCISLRVFVMLSRFLLMRVSALQPARLARANERAQGRPLRKADLVTSRPHSCSAYPVWDVTDQGQIRDKTEQFFECDRLDTNPWGTAFCRA